MERNWADEMDLSMIPPDYQPSLNQSLQELTPHYEELINRIGNLNNAVLMTHGLIGSHLNFNLKVINASFTHFVHNPQKKSLKTLLETIDELLENLIGATGTGGPIDEIIDSLKVALTLEA